MASPTLRWNAAHSGNREYALRLGLNTFGREETNSWVIDDPSVSGFHCEVIWEGEAVRVKDLGSTNGTFIDNQPVKEGAVKAGQILRLGAVDLLLPDWKSRPAAPRPATQPGPAVPASAKPLPPGTGQPLPEAPRTFFRRLPAALVYPLSKNGVFLLVAGTVLFGILNFFSGFSVIFSTVLPVLSIGYLFAYAQKIVSASAQGEKEMPDYPEFSDWWSDIVQPFLLLAWTVLFCFGPGAALFIWGAGEDPLLAGGALAMLCLGGLYFPMALLAVAVTDSFLALNPAIVIPSIFRVFLHYLTACLALALLAGVQLTGNWLLQAIPLPLVPAVASGFVSLYLLAVAANILGLIYHADRDRLGWVL